MTEMSAPDSNTLTYGLDEEVAKIINHALEEDDLSQAKKLMQNMHFADIADLIDCSKPENRRKIVDALGKDFQPEILVELSPAVCENVITDLGSKLAGKYINKLSTDNAIEVIENLDDDIRVGLELYLDISIRKAFQADMQFPENSAGRWMHKEVVVVLSNWTFGQVIDCLRRDKNLPEKFTDIYVVNTKRKPIGVLTADQLIRKPRSTKVTTQMNKDIHLVKPTVDQDEVSYLFKQYDLRSTPVVDENDRFMGVIELADIVDISDEEAEEDIMRMGGVTEQDIHYDYYSTVKQRFPWLFINLFTATLAAFVISLFHETINQTVAAASIMTIVASLGGNAGTQTQTISVRALATKDISAINSWRVIFKETIINCLNGILMSLIGFLVIFTLYDDLNISILFSFSVILSFTIAGFFGSLLPFTLDKLKIDPALASGIFLSALTDIVGFFIFLTLVALFIL